MFVNKITLAALTSLLAGAVATGAGYTGQAQARQAGKPDLRQIAAKPDDVRAQRPPPAGCS